MNVGSASHQRRSALLLTQPNMITFKKTVFAFLGLTLFPQAVGASSGTSARGGDSLPEWLSFNGEARIRYETLDNQFRANGQGGDQLLALRTLLHVEANTPFFSDSRPATRSVSWGLEVQDSRTYLGDAGTTLSSSFTNPLDVLQVYARINQMPGPFGAGSESRLTLGRQTISISSKRQIERVSYANVIKSYTGAYFTSEFNDGDQIHALYVVPIDRRPGDRDGLLRNQTEWDREQWGRQISGLHYIKKNIAPERVPHLQGEAFVYRFDESDTDAFQTPDRSYTSIGFRLFRQAQLKKWDVDIEAVYRRGTRYGSIDPDDTKSLKVRASMLIAALGYTFDMPWQPRISLEYYYASGDDDPRDARFGQYERLFGGRRTDLNNTSIHGPMTPANLSAPGFRIRVRPSDRLDGWFQYHAASLASATDSWVIAKRRDYSGDSGTFIGHALDARVRYWLRPKRTRIELGTSALFVGEFAKNASERPTGDDTYYAYLQASVYF